MTRRCREVVRLAGMSGKDERERAFLEKID
jgi:hypothetical protein